MSNFAHRPLSHDPSVEKPIAIRNIADFVPDLSGKMTVARLLHHLVVAEIGNSNQRHQQRRSIIPLTLAELNSQLDAGRAGSADVPLPKIINSIKAVQVVTDAFTDGLILLFVDEHRCMRLDEVIEVGPETQMMLVRRTMLTG